MAKVSLSMIVRNEEKNIAACLECVKDLVDDIVVVDTGSTDNTKAIAAGMGTRVFDFAWCDDFAAARNETLKHVRGKWVFWMDADDRIDEGNRDKLRALFATLRKKPRGYVMSVKSPGGAETAHLRLFKAVAGVRWRWPIHEDVQASLNELQHPVERVPITITHTGYADRQVHQKKLERNSGILRQICAREPRELHMHFLLSRELAGTQQFDGAIAALQPILEIARSTPPPEALAIARLRGQIQFAAGCPASGPIDASASKPADAVACYWFALGLAQHRANRHADASAAFREFRRIAWPDDPLLRSLAYSSAAAVRVQVLLADNLLPKALTELAEFRRQLPDDAELCFLECQMARRTGDLATAESLLRRLLNQQEKWVARDPGVTGFKSRNELATVLRQQGKLTEAESEWKQTLAELPPGASAIPCWASLTDLYIDQHRLPEAEAALAKLAECPDGKPAADQLRKKLAEVRQSRATVTLSMIVRNEENNIAACLECVKDLVDDIVVVDTGSTDNTKAIAAGMGARVFDFAWCDDFAAARNETLKHAKGDWIFWMDADDRIDEPNRGKLRDVIAKLGSSPCGYTMKITFPGRSETGIHLRLFRRMPGVAWRWPIHETVKPWLMENRIPIHVAPVSISHIGYMDRQILDRKHERNCMILAKHAGEKNADPLLHYLLSRELEALDRHEEALSALAPLAALAEKNPPHTTSILYIRLYLADVVKQDEPGSPGRSAGEIAMDLRSYYWLAVARLQHKLKKTPEAKAALARVKQLQRLVQPNDPLQAKLAAARAPRATVTLSMIVRDEEKNIADCLNCVRDLVDDIVVVDTGSTDNTKAIAESLGARVFDFTWCDDFAAARNETLKHAKGDWVFWMDADDRIDEENRGKLRALFATLRDTPCGYIMKVDLQGRSESADHLRLFRRLPGVTWRWPVHEDVAPALLALHHPIRRVPITITHIGYVDPQLLRQKQQRNLGIVQNICAQAPADPHMRCLLWRELLSLRRFDEAIAALRLILDCAASQTTLPDVDAIRHARMYIQVAARCDNPWTVRASSDAVDIKICHWFAMGLTQFRANRLAEAIAAFEEFQRLVRPKDPLTPVAWTLLAEIHYRQKRPAEMEHALAELAKCPDGKATADELRKKLSQPKRFVVTARTTPATKRKP